jgi:anti-sigma factor RsiW
MRLLDRLLRPECHQVRRVLQAYLDGELDDRHTALVAAHLEHCERCGVEADVYEQVKASLSELRPPSDPGALHRLRAFAETVPEEADDEHDGPATS